MARRHPDESVRCKAILSILKAYGEMSGTDLRRHVHQYLSIIYGRRQLDDDTNFLLSWNLINKRAKGNGWLFSIPEHPTRDCEGRKDQNDHEATPILAEYLEWKGWLE